MPVVAEGAPAQPAELKTYKNMALDEPLPDKANPQLVFLGVVLRTGKEALFGLTGAAILHGTGVCQPSATQCQAIDLQVGQSETLEVVEAAYIETIENRPVRPPRPHAASADEFAAHLALLATIKDPLWASGG